MFIRPSGLGLVYSALCPGGGVGRRAAETKPRPKTRNPGPENPGPRNPGRARGRERSEADLAPWPEGRINEAEVIEGQLQEMRA